MKSRSLTVECPYEVKGCGDIVLAPTMWQLERGIVELCLERLFRFILSISTFYFFISVKINLSCTFYILGVPCSPFL